MTTAADTSVLLDLLTDDATHDAASETALREARAAGRLIASERLLGGLRPALSKGADVQALLDDRGIDCVACSRESALLAGRRLAKYLQRGGPRGRIVPDFLIAAHARLQADRLLARDRGFFRDNSSSLKVVDPTRVG
jgi:predicted nucleic acid-binding protein